MGMGRCGQVGVAGGWPAGLSVQPISWLGRGEASGKGIQTRVLRLHSERFLTQGHTELGLEGGGW